MRGLHLTLARYRNPWHRPGHAETGPLEYETEARPASYRGFLIYRRLPQVFDVVRDGACVTQMAGPQGARSAIDKMIIFGACLPHRVTR